MRFRKILCPIDFSSGADQALRTAVQLAKASDAELVLGHVWYIPPLAHASETWTLSAEVVDTMVAECTRGLADAVATAKGLGARVTSVLLQGVPSERILALLQNDPEFDLVVVGTHGRTGIARVLLGSVAELVVRHAPCSVLAARPRIADAPFRNVLCPIDFSDSSQHALERAVEVSGDGAQLSLLHAIEIPLTYGEDPAMVDTVAELDKVTCTVLEQWAAKLRKTAKGPVTTQTRRGRPGAQILHVLDSGTYDLVVMGTHGRTGLKRMLMGSVAEKTVRHATCPVLVARTRT